MRQVPSLDLHPQALPANGPEEALQACRRFVEAQWRSGVPEIRIITGKGLHGDGTPRLRLRVEREILPAFHEKIEHVNIEQEGAVLRLYFKKRQSVEARAFLSREGKKQLLIQKEERLGIAKQRFEQAWDYLEEDDLRRAKLKVNQLLKEFLGKEPPVREDLNQIRRALDLLERALKQSGF